MKTEYIYDPEIINVSIYKNKICECEFILGNRVFYDLERGYVGTDTSIEEPLHKFKIIKPRWEKRKYYEAFKSEYVYSKELYK